jgi:hypothetical protein
MLHPMLALTLALALAPAPVARYEAVKDLPFGRTETVIGRSHGVVTELRREREGLVVRVRVAVGSFRSGNQRRDRHVARLLGDTGPDEATFEARVDPARVDQLTAGNPVGLPGRLTLGGRSREVTVQVTQGRVDVEATVTIRLSDFGLPRPRIGPFGWAGSVRDRIELSVSIPRSTLDLAAVGSRGRACPVLSRML